MLVTSIFLYDKVDIFGSNLKSYKHEVFIDFSCVPSRLYRGCQ